MIRQLSQEEESLLTKNKYSLLIEEYAKNEQLWSTPFSADEIDDFQVSYPGPF